MITPSPEAVESAFVEYAAALREAPPPEAMRRAVIAALQHPTMQRRNMWSLRFRWPNVRPYRDEAAEIARLKEALVLAMPFVEEWCHGEYENPRKIRDKIVAALNGSPVATGAWPALSLPSPAKSRHHPPMLSILITAAAYEAIRASFPDAERARSAASDRELIRIWLKRPIVDKLNQLRQPHESLSDVILRAAKELR